MSSYRIVAVNVGKPAELRHQGKPVPSGICKSPVAQPVYLSCAGFEGDGQADLVNHGGPDKALCVYIWDHYPHWERVLGRCLEPGAFGENLTVSGFRESDVRIGDTFRLGDALVQISQPRQPCFKLAARYQRESMPAEVAQTGYTGFYLRVLEEGVVDPAGAVLEPVGTDPQGMTVAEAHAIMYFRKTDKDAIRKLLAVDALAQSWRQTLERRLARLEAEPPQG
ncbi:MOSC domain-containing protein [Paenibacillus thermoaerophilus]|uniref:MOSC domain-containing protein n=1 Tax=Paenibacillus thermoaerophilus TaxID=1215385 RepID=A0ABW2UYN0_9BACL|nr:MOSC domain-containing protein [Paenibacillus thermoaerophilus]TMV15866.1 MOSC domain-containing protein [Paenibacillus thermoaerophilus]